MKNKKPPVRVISHFAKKEKRYAEIVQSKMLRVYELMRFLKTPRNLPEIAKQMSTSARTAYRYLHFLEGFGIAIDKDLRNRYFIAQDKCPICGSSHFTCYVKIKELT